MHEFTGGEGGRVVVLSSLLEGAQFETRLERDVYLVRLVGVWEAATPPSHPSPLTHRRRVHVHSLPGSLPGQPRSRLSPCMMAIARGVPRGSKVRGVIGSLPHASVVPPAIPSTG